MPYWDPHQTFRVMGHKKSNHFFFKLFVIGSHVLYFHYLEKTNFIPSSLHKYLFIYLGELVYVHNIWLQRLLNEWIIYNLSSCLYVLLLLTGLNVGHQYSLDFKYKGGVPCFVKDNVCLVWLLCGYKLNHVVGILVNQQCQRNLLCYILIWQCSATTEFISLYCTISHHLMPWGFINLLLVHQIISTYG